MWAIFPGLPGKLRTATKRVIVILFTVMIGVAAITALEQKEFSPASFEYGLPTAVDGYLFTKPVPHLQVPLGKDMWNKELYQTILLVGFGKAGANNFIFSHRPLEKEMRRYKSSPDRVPDLWPWENIASGGRSQQPGILGG